MLNHTLIPVEIAETPDAAPVRCSADTSATAALSDGQLLRRFVRDRDKAAFEQIVSRFGTLVYGIAYRSLRDRHSAEDVFQATFLILARDARKIRSPESLSAWMHGTAVRISATARRRRLRNVNIEEQDLPTTDHSPFEAITRQFQQHVVDEELQRLPAGFRAPLVLHFLEGKTCEETAAALGTTVGAVRGRLQRGKQEFKVRLMKRGVEVSAVMSSLTLWHSAAEATINPAVVSSTIVGGTATAYGTASQAFCSREALHLAAKETAMCTTGKLSVIAAVILSTTAIGWAADTSNSNSELAADAIPATVETVVPSEVVALLQPTAYVLTSTVVSPAPADDEPANAPAILKYGDGKADGKKSIAGTGEMIRFTLPNKTQKLRNLKVHCARYGHPQAPDEDVEITIVSEDGSDVVHTEFVPYDTFKRGESRWTSVRFKEEVTVPETFWVIMEFNAERTKGVYVSYDRSTDGSNSKIGVPGGEPKDVTFEGDWMVQAVLTKPE